MSFFEKIFGTFSDKELKKIKPLADKVLALDSQMQALSDEQLKAKTAEFKERLANGETLVIETAARHELSSLRQPPSVALLDAERVTMPLLLRKVEEGDRFTPFGMKGTKLVSDFLTDMKMPLHLKQRQLCLLDATQRIVWVVGQRISDNCRVSAGTKQILKMTFVTG